MHRLACVEVPALPLQLVKRRHPEWAGVDAPVAVVREDKPQSPLLWVDAAAEAHGIRAGLRYAAALSLCAKLRAAPVPPEAVTAAVLEVGTLLRRFSPHVETDDDCPGIFWLDAGGLGGLWPSLSEWARQLAAEVERAGWEAVVAAGFTRFGTWAVARAHGADRSARRVVLFATPEGERAAARRVRLERLGLEPEARDTLERLGVATVAQLVALPAAGLAERFGVAVAELREAAAGKRPAGFDPARVTEPVEVAVDIDFPETSAAAVYALVERLLPDLMTRLSQRGQELAALTLRRTLDRGQGEPEDVLELAQPTLEPRVVMDLVRLRLEGAPLAAGVVRVALAARGVVVAGEQRSLLAVRPRRDRAAGERALARLRAEFGADAVVTAAPRDGHLPEGQFGWKRLEKLLIVAPAPAAVRARRGGARLVRRILDRPREIPPPSARDPLMWFLRGLSPGAPLSSDGPYAVEGGWWTGRAVHREYCFLHTASGQVLWVFHDRVRRRWYLQGLVE